VHARQRSERLKERAQIVRSGLKAHVPDKEIFHGDSPVSKPQPSLRQKTSTCPKQYLLASNEWKMNRAVPGRQTRSGRRARTANL
jgi:hypothetical protein